MPEPAAPSLENPPPAPAAPSVPTPDKPRYPFPTYEGSQAKMEHFNGSVDGREYAIRLAPRTGEQQVEGKNALVLTVDQNDGKKERILNLDDNQVMEKNPADMPNALLLQQNGENLVITQGNNQKEVSAADLKKGAAQVFLNDTVGIEVLDYNPADRSVLIHKIRRSGVHPVAGKGPLGWFTTGVVAGSSLLGLSPDSMPPLPVPIVEAGEMPSMAGDILVDRPVEQKILDESITCPAKETYTIKPGDSLTRALIEVNGLGRYLDGNGKLDVPSLYKDLACMLVLPENLAELERTDPAVADVIKGLMSPESRAHTGPIDDEMIWVALGKVNKDPRFPGASGQLAIVQPDQEVAVPKFPK